MKILFCWELGGNLGHLHTINGPARALLAQGHEVVAAVQNITTAARVFDGTDIQVMQAPLADMADPPIGGKRPFDSYVDAINPYGFHNAASLAAAMWAWRSLIDQVQPDRVVLNAAPIAALLLSQWGRAGDWTGMYTLGTGYHMPTSANGTWPPLSGYGKIQTDRFFALQRRHGELQGNVDKALAALNLPKLDRVEAMYASFANLLTTFPELDHYYPEPRDTAENVMYVGPQFETDQGNDCRLMTYICEQGHERPAIFAYLRGKLIGEVSETLNSNRIYLSQPGHEIALSTVPAVCDLAITYGGHNTTAAMLLAGLPVIVIPQNIEQNITAGAVERLNAGASVTGHHALRAAVQRWEQYKPGAQAFAQKYQDFNPRKQSQKIADLISA